MLKEFIIGNWAAGYRFEPEEKNFKIYVALKWSNRWDSWRDVCGTSWGRDMLPEFDRREEAEYYFNFLVERLTDFNELKINNLHKLF